MMVLCCTMLDVKYNVPGPSADVVLWTVCTDIMTLNNERLTFGPVDSTIDSTVKKPTDVTLIVI